MWSLCLGINAVPDREVCQEEELITDVSVYVKRNRPIDITLYWDSLNKTLSEQCYTGYQIDLLENGKVILSQRVLQEDFKVGFYNLSCASYQALIIPCYSNDSCPGDICHFTDSVNPCTHKIEKEAINISCSGQIKHSMDERTYYNLKWQARKELEMEKKRIAECIEMEGAPILIETCSLKDSIDTLRPFFMKLEKVLKNETTSDEVASTTDKATYATEAVAPTTDGITSLIKKIPVIKGATCVRERYGRNGTILRNEDIRCVARKVLVESKQFERHLK